VIDQAHGIIQAITDYQDRDHEVLLFGKVLRHEVDEEFKYDPPTFGNLPQREATTKKLGLHQQDY
jgi:hypothetical protein